MECQKRINCKGLLSFNDLICSLPVLTSSNLLGREHKSLTLIVSEVISLFISPMLLESVKEPFNDDNYITELKLSIPKS
jgi:hypothetical protein